MVKINEKEALARIIVVAIMFIGIGIAFVANIGVALIVIGSILGMGALFRMLFKYLNG